MKRPPSEIASAISPDSVLIIDEVTAREPAEARSDEEKTLLGLIDGKRSVAEILHLSRMSGFVAMRRLRALLERKIIRPGGRLVATPLTNGGAQKNGRLGLTQDLTSAAKAFATSARERGMVQEPRDQGPPAASKQTDTRPGPPPATMKTPAEAEDRSTPLQGSVSLPSVIIAFGPEFLDGRRSPTRKISSPDAVIPPPPQHVEPAKPAQTSSLVPTFPPPTAVTQAQSPETAVMPRAVSRGRLRRRSTPHSTEQIQAQELWLSVTRRDWQTLAVVSAHADGVALSVASALAEAGSLLRGKPVELFVADGSDPLSTGEWTWNGRVSRPISLPSGGLPPAMGKFERVVALEPLASNPRGVTIAQAAEAVLMVAETGVTELRTARRAVEMIGRDRFIGCVMVSRR
jgi:hypothetical protein